MARAEKGAGSQFAFTLPAGLYFAKVLFGQVILIMIEIPSHRVYDAQRS